MTFKEALEYIEMNGLYHNDGKITYKLKITPSNINSLMSYKTDLLFKKKSLTNEDAKNYTSEDCFFVVPFNVDSLAEENHSV